MKLSKPNEQDLNGAIDVALIIDDLSKGWFPSDDEGDIEFDIMDSADCRKALDILIGISDQCSLMRAAMTTLVLCDPNNKVIDPDIDHVDQHPEVKEAMALKEVATRANEWVVSRDTGASSLAIWSHMMGCIPSHRSYPSDPSDLGRCLRLLEKVPEWKPRISEMAKYSPGWAGLVMQWEALSVQMDDEAGIDWSEGRDAPETYRTMQLAIAEGYRKDDSYECKFRSDGTLSSARKKDGTVSVTSVCREDLE